MAIKLISKVGDPWWWDIWSDQGQSDSLWQLRHTSLIWPATQGLSSLKWQLINTFNARYTCVMQRLEGLTTEDYYPLLELAKWVIKSNCVDYFILRNLYHSDGGGVDEDGGQGSPQGQRFPLHDSAKLPLAIKEKDVEYQFHRLILFSRLLESYPYSQPRIVAEALLDVCPLLRGEIWAALLGVKVNPVTWSIYTAAEWQTETISATNI